MTATIAALEKTKKKKITKATLTIKRDQGYGCEQSVRLRYFPKQMVRHLSRWRWKMGGSR